MFNPGMGGGQSALHNILMQRAMRPPTVNVPRTAMPRLPSMRFPSGKVPIPHGVRTISPIYRPTALLPSL